MADNLALVYVFGLGMVAVVNPCGFAMLPAYVGFFVGAEDITSPLSRRIVRTGTIGLSLTAGFMVVFLALGLVIQLTAGNLVARLPWVSIGLGVAMFAMGIALLRGHHINVQLPFNPAAPCDRLHRTVFVFGVSYALVSLACTIPLFLASVMTSLTGGNIVNGVLHFVAYAAGMGLVLTVLTLALSLAQLSIVTNMRKVLPYVERAGAILLSLSGVYVTYYGWYSLRVYDGDLSAGGPAKYIYDLSGQANSFIQTTGPARIGLILLAILAAALMVAFGYKRTARPEPNAPAAASTEAGDDNVVTPP